MPLTVENATRTLMCDAVVDLIDAGAAAGRLEIRETATVLASITLADPAFGAAANGVATMAGTPVQDASANNSGNANAYEFFDSDSNSIISGAIGSPTCVLGTAARNAACNAAVDSLDVGGAGRVDICNGSTVLATFTLEATAFGAAATGAAVMAGLPKAFTGLAAAGAGTNADNFKAYSGGGTLRFGGNIGATGSGASLELNNVSIAEDQPGEVTGFTVTQPANGAGGVNLVNTSITAGMLVEITSGTFTIPGS